MVVIETLSGQETTAYQRRRGPVRRHPVAEEHEDIEEGMLRPAAGHQRTDEPYGVSEREQSRDRAQRGGQALQREEDATEEHHRRDHQSHVIEEEFVVLG